MLCLECHIDTWKKKFSSDSWPCDEFFFFFLQSKQLNLINSFLNQNTNLHTLFWLNWHILFLASVISFMFRNNLYRYLYLVQKSRSHTHIHTHTPLLSTNNTTTIKPSLLLLLVTVYYWTDFPQKNIHIPPVCFECDDQEWQTETKREKKNHLQKWQLATVRGDRSSDRILLKRKLIDQ